MSDDIKERIKKIRTRLLSKGYEEKDVRAILANMDVETGGTFDPATKQRFKGSTKVKDWFKPAKGGRGTGLLQWDGPRRLELKKYAESKGKTWDDLDTQVDFLDKELKSTEKSNFKKVMKKESTEDKAKEFALKVERPGKPHLKRRVESAKKFEKENLRSKGAYLFGSPKEEEENDATIMENLINTMRKE